MRRGKPLNAGHLSQSAQDKLSSVCPFIFVAVAMIFCSFPTTGHSKGRVILPYPVIFFQCAINKFSAASCGGIKASFGLNQIFGQYQFFKLLQYALFSFLAEMGIDLVGCAADFQ